jgi:hypothetical protein
MRICRRNYEVLAPAKAACRGEGCATVAVRDEDPQWSIVDQLCSSRSTGNVAAIS